MDKSNKKVAYWPGEPPPPYGEEGKRAYEEWEKKAEAFTKTVESWNKENN